MYETICSRLDHELFGARLEKQRPALPGTQSWHRQRVKGEGPLVAHVLGGHQGEVTQRREELGRVAGDGGAQYLDGNSME